MKIVLDIEVTGFNTIIDDIIELCALKVNEIYIVRDSLYYLLKPDKRVPNNVMEMTGLKNEDLVDCKRLEEVRDETIRFFSDVSCVFVYGLLEERFMRKKFGLKTNFVDILKYIRNHYSFPKYDFKYVCQKFKIMNKKPHRADGDAMALLQLLIALRI